jgi:predicted PhzF superfamily epimerase YddE/YHI9
MVRPFEESSNMTLPLFHVDAFTHRPLSGNPAAVCILPAWREDSWLQAVAGEMNLSETAFLGGRAVFVARGELLA